VKVKMKTGAGVKEKEKERKGWNKEVKKRRKRSDGKIGEK